MFLLVIVNIIETKLLAKCERCHFYLNFAMETLARQMGVVGI